MEPDACAEQAEEYKQNSKAFRLAQLMAGFIQHTLTFAEQQELDDWVNESMDNQYLFERLTHEPVLQSGVADISAISTDRALRFVRKRLFSFKLYRLLAAAVLLMAIALPLLHSKDQPTTFNNAEQQTQPDLLPAAGNSFVQLADGAYQLLDSLHDKVLIGNNGAPAAVASAGTIIYQKAWATNGSTTFGRHSIRTGAGGQYKVRLPDGTVAWLNALSVLSYTGSLVHGRRQVNLQGEAFFEVAKDALHPFIVNANNVDIRVKGTRFNVRAYSNESVVDVLLTEGAVTINNRIALRPGQEARALSNGKMTIVKADTSAALAWKQGSFNFHNAAIEDIMKEVARWYNAGIIYKDSIDRHFTAEIPRHLPVSTLLHMLEATGEVHFSISEQNITVTK